MKENCTYMKENCACMKSNKKREWGREEKIAGIINMN